MSRIGKKPILLPKEVKVTYENSTLTVKGPKGTLTRTIHHFGGLGNFFYGS